MGGICIEVENYKKAIFEKDKNFKELLKENKELKEKYENTLNAYFELHSYCNSINDQKLIKINKL